MKQLVVSLFFTLVAVTTNHESMAQAKKTKIIAHRGAWKANNLPQNSIASLKEAIRLGCFGTEFDVHLTKDDVLVVNHDRDFYGIDIATATYEELLKIKHPNGEKIPTAEEYLREGLKQKKTRLIYELKTSPQGPERMRKAADLSVELVHRLGAQKQVDYILFSYDGGKRIIERDPKARVAYLNGDIAPGKVKADGFWGIDYHYNVFKKNPSWIKEAHDAGLTVNSWTVNNVEETTHLLNQQVEFITTDEPELLMQFVKQYKHQKK